MNFHRHRDLPPFFSILNWFSPLLYSHHIKVFFHNIQPSFPDPSSRSSFIPLVTDPGPSYNPHLFASLVRAIEFFRSAWIIYRNREREREKNDKKSNCFGEEKRRFPVFSPNSVKNVFNGDGDTARAVRIAGGLRLPPRNHRRGLTLCVRFGVLIKRPVGFFIDLITRPT